MGIEGFVNDSCRINQAKIATYQLLQQTELQAPFLQDAVCSFFQTGRGTSPDLSLLGLPTVLEKCDVCFD